jgi:cytochrome b
MTRDDAATVPTSTCPDLVWDWPLRAFHWAIVACVAGSFATHYAGIEWFDWHRRLGYATLVLVLFRIAWGWVGTRHARFASFVRGPRSVLEYLRGRGAAGAAGHNPLGALSVLAFLAVLLAQAATGLFANDEIANAGPFYGWVTDALSNRLTALHEANSWVLVALIALHLAAVAWYDLRRRAGLVQAMVTGRKPGTRDGVESSRGWLAVAIVALLAVALALAIRAAPEASVGYSFY